MEIYCVSCKKNTANENSSEKQKNQTREINAFIKLCYLWKEKIEFH